MIDSSLGFKKNFSILRCFWFAHQYLSGSTYFVCEKMSNYDTYDSDKSARAEGHVIQTNNMICWSCRYVENNFLRSSILLILSIKRIYYKIKMIGTNTESREFFNFVWLKNYHSDAQIVNYDLQWIFFICKGFNLP